MRLKEASEGDDVVCTARSFKLTKDPQNGVLHYDCPFIDARDEGTIFNVDLELVRDSSVQIRRFLFQVPPYSEMKTNKQMFVYVDNTNPTNIVLKIQALPAHLNVTFYKVDVWRERESKSTKMDIGFIDATTAENGELAFSFNTWQEWGDYFFVVSFLSNICAEHDNCGATFTPKVTIGAF